MITNIFLREYLGQPSVLFLDPVLRIVLVSEKIEAYTLRS